MKKIVFMALAVMLLFSASLSIGQYTFAEIEDIDSVCKQKTETDAPCGVSIYNYVDDFKNSFKDRYSYTFGQASTCVVARGEFFQNNSEIHGGNYTNFDTYVYGSDLITDFVPEELFKNVGEKFYIGRGYGFFIRTRKISNSERLFSTVVLFDKIGEAIEDYKVVLNVTPLMVMNYIYVEDRYEYQASCWENGDFYVDGSRSVFKNGTTEAVIPWIVFNEWSDSVDNTYKHRSYVYKEPENFKISNISFGANIYNANALNSFDDGYQIDNDYGYFFIGNEYEFDVKKTVKEEALPTILSLGDTIFSACIGTISKKIGKIGEVISVVGNVIKVGEALDACLTGMTYNETNKNAYYPSVHNFNTRATQKEKYGMLLKTSAIVLNTTGKDELFFESGDYAKGTYLISHTDKPDGTKEYSRLDACVGLKVKCGDEEKAYVSNAVSYDLSTPEMHEMNAIGQTDYYILPNGQMNFSFVPRYNGTYTFNVGSGGIDLCINGVSGTLDNYKYTTDMSADMTYSVVLRNTTDVKKSGKVDVDCSDFVGEKTLLPNEERLYRFSYDSEELCLLTTNNNSVKFRSEYDSDFKLSLSFNAYEYYTYVSNGKIYLVVKNTTDTSQKFVGEKKLKRQLVSGGNIALSDNEHNAMYEYTSGANRDYNFVLTYGTSGDKLSLKFLDEDRNSLPYSVVVEDNYRQYIVTLRENQTVKILVTKSPSTNDAVSEKVDISTSDATVWYADGVKLASPIVSVRRGQRVKLETEVADGKKILLDSVSPKQLDDICYASSGYIYVRETASVGSVELALRRKATLYDEQGNATSTFVESYIGLNVMLEDVSDVISSFNDNSGIGVAVKNGVLDGIKIRVSYGSSYKELEIEEGRTLLNNTFNYNTSTLTLTVRVVYVKYTYSEDNISEIGIIKAGTHGLPEMSFTLNPLFDESSTKDGYNISCIRHFGNIAKGTNGKYYLTNNINFAGGTINTVEKFTGSFNGNGHKLSNFKLVDDSSMYGGLFGTLSGTIYNLVLSNTSVNINRSGSKYFGILVGSIDKNSFVSNCKITGTNSIVISTKGSAVVGGIAGYLQGGRLSNSSFCGTVNVTGATSVEVGGLVGRNSSGAICFCWTSGKVNAKSSANATDIDCGGLVGRNVCDSSTSSKYPEITNCYSTSTVYAEATGDSSYVYSGGLVGVLKDTALTYAYCTGSVTAKNKNGRAVAGGFVGDVENCGGTGSRWVMNVFSAGNVTANGKEGVLFFPGESYYGHFTGMENGNSFSKVYYSTNAKLECSSGGVEKKWNVSWYIGKTTAELKKASFQINEMGLVESIWKIVDGQFPTLR